MKSKTLNARAIPTLEPGAYVDGEGLRLIISQRGKGKWVLRYVTGGTRREMGLGGYPAVSLADARRAAEAARGQVRAGGDPIAARAVVPVRVPTFDEAATAFIEGHRAGWRSEKHTRQWGSTLKTYASPQLGNTPVDEIGTEDILKVLQPIWTTKTVTAARVQGRLENVLDFAAARTWRDSLNPARWRGHLDKLLPRPSKVQTVVHHPAMPHAEVPGFMAELASRKGISALALRFLILTATRTSETLQAQWSEIDLAAAVWIIPASRMKGAREHRIPLSEAALEVLRTVPRVVDEPWVFPGVKAGRPISDMALLQLMRGMGYGFGGNRGDYVPHGFRSSFRDWAGETTNFPANVAEAALAHVLGDKTEIAYARGTLFEKRRNLMNAWADYCTGGNPLNPND